MAFATVNGVRLFYEVSGRGAPIVLIPGLGLDHTYFRYAIPELERHFQVVAYDPRGIGQSDRPAIEYTMERWADDLEAAIRPGSLLVHEDRPDNIDTRAGGVAVVLLVGVDRDALPCRARPTLRRGQPLVGAAGRRLWRPDRRRAQPSVPAAGWSSSSSCAGVCRVTEL